MSRAQQKALTSHRRRRRESGVVRLEVQVPSADVAMVRDLAATLRGDAVVARDVRAKVLTAIGQIDERNILDVFGSDLPDACFEGVFDERRQNDPPRDVDL